MLSIFDNIDSPEKLKKLGEIELHNYAHWLRDFLIQEIPKLGGHFAANLGVVELTVALHYVFNSPHDKMIWDVGHQAYPHKILTGRKENFHTLRQKGGLSGFPKMAESECDAFGTGHSSSSISAVLGYAIDAELKNINRQNIAIIGDGALSSGQAFEGFNNAGLLNSNITIIINDNHIGIDPSQGAMGEYLQILDNKFDNLFTDFGFQFFGPIDGHNLNNLIHTFETTKEIDGPKIIHIKTTKGKGHAEAEQAQTNWHSVSKFDKLSKTESNKNDNGIKFQDVFGRTLLELAEKDTNVYAVTPAMISGSSLNFMQEKFPNRVFDVGIAEQHAVTFSAGLVASGAKVFCCLYSTFLQRAVDQIIHDVALQNLPVIFAIDRAGFVGEDGPTHHGVFDVNILQSIPNMTIISPKNQEDLRNAIFTAYHHKNGPIAVRYPRGKDEKRFTSTDFKLLPMGKANRLKKGKKTALITYGLITNTCLNAAENLDVSVYEFPFIKPLDMVLLSHIFDSYETILVFEETQKIGGLGSTIAVLAYENEYKGVLKITAIQDYFAEHAPIESLLETEGLNKTNIIELIKSSI